MGRHAPSWVCQRKSDQWTEATSTSPREAEVDLHGGSPGPPLRQQAAVGAAVVALVAVLLAGLGVIGAVRDEPYCVFTKEVIEQTGVRTYTGFLAHIKWFLWVVAGAAGLLAAAVPRRLDPRDRRIPFFLGTSALTARRHLDPPRHLPARHPGEV